MKAKKPERFMLRLEVVNGRRVFVAADGFTARRLAEKGYRTGDVLAAQLRKARNPKFHRLVHGLGTALIENTDDFAHYTDSHAVLKRLQIEANVGCDVMLIKAPGLGMLEHRTPKSLSFESMDEQEFQGIFKGFCCYVARTYWPSMTPEQIEQMAQLMGEAG